MVKLAVKLALDSRIKVDTNNSTITAVGASDVIAVPTATGMENRISRPNEVGEKLTVGDSCVLTAIPVVTHESAAPSLSRKIHWS